MSKERTRRQAAGRSLKEFPPGGQVFVHHKAGNAVVVQHFQLAAVQRPAKVQHHQRFGAFPAALLGSVQHILQQERSLCRGAHRQHRGVGCPQHLRRAVPLLPDGAAVQCQMEPFQLPCGRGAVCLGGPVVPGGKGLGAELGTIRPHKIVQRKRAVQLLQCFQRPGKLERPLGRCVTQLVGGSHQQLGRLRSVLARQRVSSRHAAAQHSRKAGVGRQHHRRGSAACQSASKNFRSFPFSATADDTVGGLQGTSGHWQQLTLLRQSRRLAHRLQGLKGVFGQKKRIQKSGHPLHKSPSCSVFCFSVQSAQGRALRRFEAPRSRPRSWCQGSLP